MGSPQTLLVGIANPATMPRLMKLAALIACGASYRVVVANVVRVPAQIGLSTAASSTEVALASALLRQAIRAGRRHGIQARGVVEVAREPHDGLLSAVDSQQADVLLVGYSGEPEARRTERAFDRLMHRVASRARADVVVAKLRREGSRRVLVPIAGGANLELIGALARAAASQDGAEVRFLHLIRPEAGAPEAEATFHTLLEQHGLDEVGAVEVLGTADPVRAILERADQVDLTIVGSAGRRSLSEAVFGTIAERIAAQATSSVLLAQANR